MGIKSYYHLKDTGSCNYSLDGLSFTESSALTGAFSGYTVVIGIDPNNGNNVIFAGTDPATNTTQIAVSNDYGLTFNTPIGDWFTYSSTIDLNPNSGSGVLYLSSERILIYDTNYIFLSTDSGLTFDLLVDLSTLYFIGATISKIALSFNSISSGYICLSSPTAIPQLFKTLDGGITWELLPNAVSAPVSGMIVQNLFADFVNDAIVTVTRTGIFKSTNDGAVFNPVYTFPSQFILNFPIALTFSKGKLFCINNVPGEIIVSEDLGSTWSVVQVPTGNTTSLVNKLIGFDDETSVYPGLYFTQGLDLYISFDGALTSQYLLNTGNQILDFKTEWYQCDQCPPQYIQDIYSNQCIGTSVGDLVCPAGFTYDPDEQHCICEGECDCPSIDLVFAIDVGPSVNGTEIAGLKNFFTDPNSGFFYQPDIVDLINQNKLRIAAVTFSTSLASQLTPTSDLQNCINYINTFVASYPGGTNTAIGLAGARNLLFNTNYYNPNSIKKMVILTDGWPNGVEHAEGSVPFENLISITDGTKVQYTTTADSTNTAANILSGNVAQSYPEYATLTLNTTLGLEAGMTIKCNLGMSSQYRFNIENKGVILEVVDGTTIKVTAAPYFSNNAPELRGSVFASPSTIVPSGIIYEVDTPTRTYPMYHDYNSPCGRIASTLSDCDRCMTFRTAMEVAHDIKTLDGVSITAGFLSSLPNGGPAYTFQQLLTPVQNPGNAFGVESYLTHRALILGLVDQMTHIFPPSEDPTNTDYYVASGYEPPNPIVGGNLGNLGLTGQVEGIPFGRLLYKYCNNPLDYNLFSSVVGSWAALPIAYNNITLTGVTDNCLNNSAKFNPLGTWDCDPADIDPSWIPMTSLRVDGNPDFYIETFDNAASIMAPAIASNLCTAIIPVDCGDCTPVQDGDNVRCNCQSALDISPCITKVYACDDTTFETPLYCTTNDLVPGQVAKIQVDGLPVEGCFIFQSTTEDYCDPLNFSDVIVMDVFADCVTCAGFLYKLSRCDDPTIFLYTDNEAFAEPAALSKSIELNELPGLCWTAAEVATSGDIMEVTIKQIFDDCQCCIDYN